LTVESYLSIYLFKMKKQLQKQQVRKHL